MEGNVPKDGAKKTLEEKVESFSDVLRSPLKGAFNEAMRDVIEAYDTTIFGSAVKRTVLANLATIVGFGLTSGPHELIHAGINKLVGGENKEIVVNTLYGGKLYEWLLPGVQSKLLLPFLGGYVQHSELPYSQNLAVAIAPYIFTHAGIYLARKGKELKSIPIAAIGAGLIAAHASSMFGDFWGLGARTCQAVVDNCYYLTGKEMDLANTPGLPGLIGLAGLYVGWKAMSFTYRLSKAAVNHFTQKPKTQSSE